MANKQPVILTMDYERRAAEQGFAAVCGVDEAGRGPLCGNVVAAAVILPQQAVLLRVRLMRSEAS